MQEKWQQKTKYKGNKEEQRENIKMEEKLYRCLAFDKNGRLLLDENKEPIVSHATPKGEEPNWRSFKLSIHPEIKEKYKVEFVNSGDKEQKKQNKIEARNQLLKMAKEDGLIEQALKETDLETEINKKENVMEDAYKKEENKQEVQKRNEVIVDNEKEKEQKCCIKIEQCLLDMKQHFDEKIEDNQALDTLINNFDDSFKQMDNIQSVMNECEKDLVGIKQSISQSNKKAVQSAEDVVSRIREVNSNLKNNYEQIISKTKSVERKVIELSEVTETMEGKLQKLDKLQDIVDVLSDKGVEISREIAPMFDEEEDIINLVRYSKRITEELGYAARDLIRKKAVFESRGQHIENEQKIMEQKVKEEYEKGIEVGKVQLIKELLNQYTDIDIIREEGPLHCVWTVLHNNGVEIDGDGHFENGRELVLQEDNAEKMSAKYKGIDGSGKYKVVKTGLCFGSEIVFYAQFEKLSGLEEENK